MSASSSQAPSLPSTSSAPTTPAFEGPSAESVERDANLATLMAALLLVAGPAGAWFGQSFVVVDDTIGAAELMSVVVAMLLPPLLLTVAIELLVRRLRARTSDPPRRARLAQRMILPLVCFAAISGFLTAFGSLFLSRFLYF